MNPLKYYIKKALLLFKKGRIERGINTVIETGTDVDPGTSGYIQIGSNCYIHKHAYLKCYDDGKIIIGDNVSINPFCVLYGIGTLRIGANVRIAAHTVIVPANHKFSDPKVNICAQGISKKGVTIEEDVWIGANATVLDGVHIGKHSVIGAGSVVTSNIPAYSVAVGVPCRVIRRINSSDPQSN